MANKFGRRTDDKHVHLRRRFILTKSLAGGKFSEICDEVNNVSELRGWGQICERQVAYDLKKAKVIFGLTEIAFKKGSEAYLENLDKAMEIVALAVQEAEIGKNGRILVGLLKKQFNLEVKYMKARGFILSEPDNYLTVAQRIKPWEQDSNAWHEDFPGQESE